MLFPDTLHAGSTKGWTGHTLGAAGIVESVFALIALEDGLLPGTLNSEARDTACGAQIHLDNARWGSRRCEMKYTLDRKSTRQNSSNQMAYHLPDCAWK